MKIIGISRAARFSPNSVSRDAAIFNAVSELLKEHGHEVATYDEDNLPQHTDADAVYGMARETSTLQRLAEWESEGVPIVNSPTGLLKFNRAKLVQLFEEEAVSQPTGLTIDFSALPDEADEVAAALSDFSAHIIDTLHFPLWIKSGVSCAKTAADVQFINIKDTADDAQKICAVSAVLQNFRASGISAAVVMEHIEGDLLKFYGVEGTDFFDFFYPTKGEQFSKFDLEKHNGTPCGYSFDSAALKAEASRAARLTGYHVYGGDAVVRRDGTFCIIDFNDWPSFSVCCDAAAAAIVQRIESCIV